MNIQQLLTHMLCRTLILAVDGVWTEWSAFGSCTTPVGTAGTRDRTRTCSNPPPYFGGQVCPGNAVAQTPCGVFDPGKILQEHRFSMQS